MKIILIIFFFICTNVSAQPSRPDILLGQLDMTPSGGSSSAEWRALNTSLASLTKTGVVFPTTGTYRVDISGYRSNTGTPILNILIDGVLKGTVTINSATNSPSSAGIFSGMTSSITAGTHDLTVQLANYTQTCRVAIIYLTQTSSTLPGVFPAIASPRVLPSPFASSYLSNLDFAGRRLRGFNKGGLFSSNGDMDAMKATGANIVRLWVDMDTVVSGNSYVFQVSDTATLRSNINYFTSIGGVYVVITTNINPNDVNQIYWGAGARAIAYRASIASKWKALANVWKSSKVVAAYDMVNEPRTNNYADMIRFQQQMIDSIRLVDANHVIAVEVNNNDMLQKFVALPDANLIYSPHGYSSFSITHQGVASTETIRNKYPTITPTANQGVFGKTDLSLQHSGPRAMANRFHVPIWYGEFSCASWAPLNDGGKWSSTEWINDNISLIEAEGFSWVYHAWRPIAAWDPEIPSSYFQTLGFTNAAPTGYSPGSTVVSAARSPTAPTIVMLEGWFGLNTVPSPYKCYYFSATGNDLNTGLSSASPKKTLNELNRIFAVINPGDSVMFKRGDIFYGSIVANKSGTSALPIVIGSYGSGAKPVVTGFTDLTSWTSLGGNLWKTTVTGGLSVETDIVTKNGVVLPMGRYPNDDAVNGGFLHIDSYNRDTSITDAALPTSPNWTGAEMVMRRKRWILQRYHINFHNTSTHTIFYERDDPRYVRLPDDFLSGYFIQNSLLTLDKLNEWYYNPSTKELTIYSPSNPGTVKIATQTDLFYSDQKSYITISGVDFSGANGSAITFLGGTRNTVKDSKITSIADRGIYTSASSYFLGDRDTTDYCMSYGVRIFYNSNYNTIQNSVLTHTAIIRGLGRDVITGSGIQTQAKGTYIYNNRIINTGADGVYGQRYDSIIVENNFIDSSNQVVDDGGGIYFVTGANYPISKGQKIKDNIIINGGAGGGSVLGLPVGSAQVAHGIYMDLGSSGTELTGNSVAGSAGNGLLLNYNIRNLTLTGNTVFNNKRQFYNGIRAPTSGYWETLGLTITGNLFFSRTASQDLTEISSDIIRNTGTMNSNKYATSSTTTPYWLAVSGYGHYNLAGWRTNTTYDALSTQKTFLPTDSIRFYYNASQNSVAQNLSGATWFDAAGTTYTSLTLAPFESRVLIRGAGVVPNQKPTVTLIGPADGTVLTGSPQAVLWTATASDPDGTIRDVKLYNGSQMLDVDATSAYNGIVTMNVGNYSLTAHATDNLGDSTISSPAHNVIINAANVAPTVSITSPSSGTTDTTGATINFAATSSDADGTVSLVKWYDGNILLSSDNSSPYIYSYTATRGTHYFTAVSFDNSGDSSVSSVVTIQINDPLQTLQIIIDSYNALCFGNTAHININGSGGLPFSYGYIGQKDTLAHAGSYSFTIIDSAGNTATQSVTVTQPAVLNASALLGTITVFKGSAQVSINVTGGTAPYQYSINSGVSYQSSNTFTVKAGVYSYSVRDANGCIVTGSFTMVQPKPSGNDKIIHSNSTTYINLP